MLLAAPIAVNAAGLGEISVLSRLGQPLHAEIEVRIHAGERIDDSCFRLEPSRPNDAGIARIGRGKITIRQVDGQSRLVVTTPSTMREPLYQLAVRIGCGVDIVRDYAVLLSPGDSVPSLAPARSVPFTAELRPPATGQAAGSFVVGAEDSTPASIARFLYPYSRRLQRQFAAAMIAANPDLGLKADSPVPPGATLRMPDMRQASPASITPPLVEPRAGRPAVAEIPKSLPKRERLRAADRLSIGRGDVEPGPFADPVLRLATELASAVTGGAANGVSDIQRDIFRIEYRLLAGFAEFQASPADPGERRHPSPQRANDYRRLADLLDGGAPVSAQAPPPAAKEPVAAGQTLPPASTAPVAEPASPVRPALPAWLDWLFYGGMVVAVGGVAGFLVYRRESEATRRSSRESFAEIAARTEAAVNPFAVPVRSGAAVAPAIPGNDRDDDRPEVDRPAPEPTPGAEVDPLPAFAAPISVSPELDDFTVSHELDDDDSDVVELAEIMLAFGRVNGATEVLREFIERDPKKALPPWMKLLDVYRSAGMRADFEAIAARLNQTYNVQVETWDASTIRSIRPGMTLRGNIDAVSLEEFPHLVDVIGRLWGTEAGLEFLERLLRDNRDGERIGFRREVAEEIVFLGDLVRARLRQAQAA